MPSVAQIDQLLPQTQCTQCGYPGCLEYAQAIKSGKADINQCPPGGEATISALAKFLNRRSKPLNPEYGKNKARQVAKIIEKDCIGCLLCIKVCPVDAIIGSNKLMHSVIENECTGCALCLPPCPMDCIQMIAPEMPETTGPWRDYSFKNAENSRIRLQNRSKRLSTQMGSPQNRSKQPKYTNKKQIIEQAIIRVRAKRG